MAEFNTSYISRGDPRFPPFLNEIKDCPSGLYYKGNLCNEKLNLSLAVVGSRHNTRYTLEVLRLLFPDLIAKQVCIVSGFMYGVDYEAHMHCLDFGGYTVAVLPYGIDFEPPQFMKNLYIRILVGGGALVSEYPGKHPPEKWTFIARNRIVAGLSRGVMIVEASMSSGSLITARKAHEYGRKVLVTPGSITSSVSVGTNYLIKNGLDGESVAQVNCAQDVFHVLGVACGGYGAVFESQRSTNASTNVQFPQNNQTSFDFVSSGDPELIPQTFDISGLLKFVKLNSGITSDHLQELVPELKSQTAKLIYCLTKLQIDGYIVEEGGRYYAC